MNTAYRVWDGDQMYYWDEDHLSLTLKNDGSWLLWHSSGGGCVVSSDDEEAVLMKGTDQFDIWKDEQEEEARIYARDIVQQEETAIGSVYGPEPFIGEVKMVDGSWCIVNEKKEECRPLFSETATNTILGDVFQNPELLEGAE